MIKQTCANCKYSGKQFQLGGKTHVHCENEELYPSEKADERQALETLRQWFNKCEKHEFKPEILEP
jgi:hypothetical protein